MYGLFTKVGAGAVFSAGLSVLGIGMFCAEDPPSNHNTPAAVTAAAAIDAEASVGVVGITPGGPGNHNPGNHNPGNQNPGNQNPGPQNPPPNCGCDDDAIVVVDPELDVDVDVDVDVDLEADLSLIGTVGGVVDGLLPGSDCGCDPHAPQPVLGLPLLGLGH